MDFNSQWKYESQCYDRLCTHLLQIDRGLKFALCSVPGGDLDILRNEIKKNWDNTGLKYKGYF
jgi:hypothetical protein